MTSPTPPPDPYQPPAGPTPPASALPSSPAPPAGASYPAAPQPAPPSPYADGSGAPTATMPHPSAGSPYGDRSNSGLPQDPGTDGFSIASLVTGILSIGPVAIGLGIAGLVRTKKSGRRGKGLSIAGIVLGALSTLTWSAVIGLIAFAANSDEFQESFTESFEEGFSESYQQSMGLDMVVGDCFDAPDDLMSGEPMVPAACAGSHDAEVIAVEEFGVEEFPGEKGVVAEVETLCLDAFSQYIGTEYADSELDVIYFFPTQASWELGDRLMLCGAVTMDGSPLEGSVAGTGI